MWLGRKGARYLCRFNVITLWCSILAGCSEGEAASMPRASCDEPQFQRHRSGLHRELRSCLNSLLGLMNQCDPAFKDKDDPAFKVLRSGVFAG